MRGLGNPVVLIPNPCAASSILAGGISKINLRWHLIESAQELLTLHF